MKTAFTFLFLLITAPLVGAQQPHNQKRVFSIQISIVQDSLQEELFRRNGYFVIYADITNISGEKQTIIVWTQPGWSWLSDSPVIHPDIDATKNYPTTDVLLSGEVFRERVGLFLSPRIQKPVTFRLGFFARAASPISGRPDAIPQDQISWSNAVTLAP